MPKELLLLRAIQAVIVINTLLLALSIYFVRTNRKGLHKKINSFVVISTILGVIGLGITVVTGWDYSQLVKPFHLLIHRSFSIPLAFILPATAYFGWREKVKFHRIFVSLTIPLWLGTLITGLIFF